MFTVKTSIELISESGTVLSSHHHKFQAPDGTGAHRLIESVIHEAVFAARDADYYELIQAVGNKHQGETRHQTALRYIRQAEQGTSVGARLTPHDEHQAVGCAHEGLSSSSSLVILPPSRSREA